MFDLADVNANREREEVFRRRLAVGVCSVAVSGAVSVLVRGSYGAA